MPSFSPFTTLNGPGVIVHASESWYRDVAAGRFDCFEKLGFKARAEAMVTAVAQAGFDYEKYLFWFLAQNLLEPAKPEFADLAWARITAARAEALA